MVKTLLSIPDGFQLFGLNVKFYGIITALSYLLGVVIVCLLAKKRGLKTDDIITLACYVIPFAILGARLYYVLFKLENYSTFWDFFKIWEGGLAFYGGVIGGFVAVVIYCLIHKKKIFAVLDIIAPALLISQALGRWGNFFNQEAFGNPVENPALQWFPFAVYIDGSGWHLATFFYEFLWNSLSFVVLMCFLYKDKFKHNGMIAVLYLILYGLGRLWIEGLRTDSLYFGSVRISQLVSGLMVVSGFVLLAIYCYRHRKKKKDSFEIIMDAIKKPL